MGGAAQAGRLRGVGELGGLRAAAAGQAVGGRPGREGCGHRRGGDDLADPLTGRRALRARVPPGVGLGVAASLGARVVLTDMLTHVLTATMATVLAVPLEQAELATAVTPGTCAQEFPYAVPRPATQP